MIEQLYFRCEQAMQALAIAWEQRKEELTTDRNEEDLLTNAGG